MKNSGCNFGSRCFFLPLFLMMIIYFKDIGLTIRLSKKPWTTSY